MERRRADTEKLGGRAQVIRIDWQDAEVRIAFEPEDPLTPETVYDARWALELLGRARRRLEQEQAALGRTKAFCTLRPFLGDEGVRAGLSYEAAAQALNIGLSTLKTLIHRLRRRHTQLLREQVAQTVLDSNDVDAEAHALCEALVQAQGRVPCALSKDLRSRGEVPSTQPFALTWRGCSHCHTAQSANH
jgi:hypothetical protein